MTHRNNKEMGIETWQDVERVQKAYAALKAAAGAANPSTRMHPSGCSWLAWYGATTALT
jgi:hypothetical protein